MSVNEKIVGIVSGKKGTESDNSKAPKGTFYIDKKRFTVWDEEIWKSIEEGKSYAFLYSEKENSYQGKTYTNRNIVSGMPDEPLVKSDLILVDLPVFVDDSVKEIHLPQGIINYLKEIL